MTDEQVLANVMLSKSLLWSITPFYTLCARHQLFGLSSQEKLAERQVLAHQDYHGQACPCILDALRVDDNCRACNAYHEASHAWTNSSEELSGS